jgi:hypothetical protein
MGTVCTFRHYQTALQAYGDHPNTYRALVKKMTHAEAKGGDARQVLIDERTREWQARNAPKDAG